MAKRKPSVSDLLHDTAVDCNPRVKQLLADNTRLRAALTRKEANVDIVTGILKEVYQVPSGMVGIPAPSRSTNKRYVESAAVHLTDVHYGKLTSTYSSAKCRDRMIQVFEAVQEIVELRRKAAAIDTIHVLLGGDMIEGQCIFPGQEWETDSNLVDQVFKGGPEVIANFILSLCAIFPTVVIDGVPGNHGRIQKMGVGSFNADSIFYEVVRGIVNAAKPKSKIVWNLPYDRDPGVAWYAKTLIEGHGVALIHGDFKGPGNQLGYPWYSIGRRAAQWAAVIGDFTYLYVGHNHTWAGFESAGKIILATGSVESDNSYAAKNFAAMGRPHQRLSFYNRNHGLLADHCLYLK